MLMHRQVLILLLILGSTSRLTAESCLWLRKRVYVREPDTVPAPPDHCADITEETMRTI